MQHPTATVIAGTLSLGRVLEADRMARQAERAMMAEDASQARAASAVRRLGLELAASHQREEDLREELAAMRERALRAEGLLLRIARQQYAPPPPQKKRPAAMRAFVVSGLEDQASRGT